jgi:signal transduction histidine kinase
VEKNIAGLREVVEMDARCAAIGREHSTGASTEAEPLALSIQAIADMLRACVGADVCLIAIERSGGEGTLYGAQDAGSGTEGAASQTARALLDLPAAPVLSNSLPGRDPATRRAAAALAAVVNLRAVNSFLCLPLRIASMNARVCIASEQRCFTSADLADLTPIAEQARTLIECIHFGERLVPELACYERRQISRDLHDSAIQPFIGLKLGLEALRRRLAKEIDLAKDLDDLIALAEAGIGELRDYVGTLRAASAGGKVDDFASAVRCQAKKFSTLYGIKATVSASGDFSIAALMQHEVMQIIREGLSNIRRHTAANRAIIHLRQLNGKLLVEISNENSGEARPWRGFRPRSICERAEELGGRVRASRRKGFTVVRVELPL